MAKKQQPIPPGPVLGASGASPTVEWQGQTYTLGHPTQHAKDVYCESLLDAEKGAIDQQFERGWITAAEKSAKYDELGGRADRQDHKTGGPLWREYAGGEKFQDGLHRFVWALFREHHPDLPLATVRAMLAGSPDAVKLAVRRVIPDFFDWMAEGLNVPRRTLDEAAAPVLAKLDQALTALGG